jgi:Flp pilus assembly protein TadG
MTRIQAILRHVSVLRASKIPAAQRGQAVVEMAGAMTFLLLLVIGIFDFSPAIVRAAQLTQATRDGAAYARTAPANTFQIRKRVVNSAPAIYGTMTDIQIAAMTDTQIAVTCFAGLSTNSKHCSSAAIGDSVTVTAAYNYQTVTGLFSALLDAPIEIRRSATTEIL